MRIAVNQHLTLEQKLVNMKFVDVQLISEPKCREHL